MAVLVRLLVQLAAMAVSLLLWRWASGRGSVEMPPKIGLKAKLAAQALGVVVLAGVVLGLLIATVALLLLHGPMVVVATFAVCIVLAVYAAIKLTTPIYRSLKSQQRLRVLDDLDQAQDR